MYSAAASRPASQTEELQAESAFVFFYFRLRLEKQPAQSVPCSHNATGWETKESWADSRDGQEILFSRVHTGSGAYQAS